MMQNPANARGASEVGLLVAIVALVAAPLQAQANEGQRETSQRDPAPRLPRLWDPDWPDFYHILAEVKLPELQSTFMLEEWASAELQSFRLDLLQPESGRRQTLLVDGRSQEKFHFRPFVCAPVSSVGELDTPVARFFPSSHPLLVAGLGSIWTRAAGLEPRPSFQRAKPSQAAGYERQRPSSVLFKYDYFSARADADFPFETRLYVQPQLAANASGAAAPDARSVVLVSLLEPSERVAQFRARIVEFRGQEDAVFRSGGQAAIFELPLGYGCARRPAAAGSSYAPPANCFDARPRAFELDAWALVAGGPELDADKWPVHSSSVRLVAGPLLGRDYLAVRRRDFEGAGAGRAPRLRRTKQVWDLGATEPGTGAPQPQTFYELDERLGRCLAQGQARLGRTPQVEFAMLVDGHHEARVGLALDAASLAKLFVDSAGFRPVRESRKYWLSSRRLVEERRERALQLLASDGGVAWSGPASIVREFSVSDSDYSRAALASSAEEQRVSVSLHLYSDSLDRLLGRVRLSLAPGRLVGAAELHRELAIGPCLAPGLGDSWRVRPPRLGLDFQLHYALEPGRALRLAEDGNVEQQVYAGYLQSVARLAAGRLEPLQLDQLSVLVGRDSVVVSGRLFEWPHLFNFERRPALNFGPESRRDLLVSELKASAASCAQSCAHYSCRAFSYCSQTQVCQLLADSADSRAPGLHFEPDESCSVFSARLGKQRQPLSPGQLVARQRRAILADSSRALQANPMRLELRPDDAAESAPIGLVPSAIVTGAQQVDALGLATDMLDERLNTFAAPISADYHVVRRNRRFKRPARLTDQFPLHESNHLSYQDCESLCEKNDCRSFAYCQLERTCLISGLLGASEIGPFVADEASDLCNIMARNYLSKFHKLSQAAKRPEAASKQLELATRRDCAIHCFEEQQFRCRSFVFCQPAAGAANCLLRASREAQSLLCPEPAAAPAPSDPTRPADGQAERCELYLRSYLMEFEHFYGKQLRATESESDPAKVEIIVRPNLGAELCASRCADEILDSDSTRQCRAFFVCRGDTSSHRQPICGIRSEPVGGPVALGQPRGLDADLVDSADCTSFIVSYGSHLYDAIKLPDEQPSDSGAGDSLPAAEARPLAFGGWFACLLVVCIGLVVGYAAAWLFVGRC